MSDEEQSNKWSITMIIGAAVAIINIIAVIILGIVLVVSAFRSFSGWRRYGYAFLALFFSPIYTLVYMNKCVLQNK